ncbi:MAG: hypothetical protein ACRBCS_15835 [Cellvibrionaceae bacterium]
MESIYQKYISTTTTIDESDPTKLDIVCRLLENGDRFFSFKQAVWFAGGSSMGWGDSLDKSRNLSINILNRFLPGEDVQLYVGSVSRSAHLLSEAFLRDIISPMPEEGARLPAGEIIKWIDQNSV